MLISWLNLVLLGHENYAGVLMGSMLAAIFSTAADVGKSPSQPYVEKLYPSFLASCPLIYLEESEQGLPLF